MHLFQYLVPMIGIAGVIAAPQATVTSKVTVTSTITKTITSTSVSTVPATKTVTAKTTTTETSTKTITQKTTVAPSTATSTVTSTVTSTATSTETPPASTVTSTVSTCDESSGAPPSASPTAQTNPDGCTDGTNPGSFFDGDHQEYGIRCATEYDITQASATFGNVADIKSCVGICNLQARASGQMGGVAQPKYDMWAATLYWPGNGDNTNCWCFNTTGAASYDDPSYDTAYYIA